jgi:hypothetical protein
MLRARRYYDKPHVNLQHYDKTRHNVLICLCTGAVFILSSYNYGPAATRMAHQHSPALDNRTYRCCVVRPGQDIMAAIRFVTEGWKQNP